MADYDRSKEPVTNLPPDHLTAKLQEARPQTGNLEGNRYPDQNKAAELKSQMIMLLTPPASGSFPLQISKDDLKKVGINLLYVAASAVITYLLQSVLPALHSDNVYVMMLIPTIAAGLQSAQKWLSDTRPADEQQRLPYKVYKQRIEGLKQQLKLATVDPHLSAPYGYGPPLKRNEIDPPKSGS